MTYTKPQLHGYSAIAVIQSGTSKGVANSEPNPNQAFPSIPAYEADE